MPFKSGPSNPKWKGGTWTNSKGYIMVWAPKHPACNCRNYAPLHRKVFYDYHGYLPEVGWDIHHWNDNKLDNEISNLEPKEKVAHGKHHGHRSLAKGDPKARELGRKGGLVAASRRMPSTRKRGSDAKRSPRPKRAGPGNTEHAPGTGGSDTIPF